MKPSAQREPYHPPKLEIQANYPLLTGVSLPIGTNILPDIDTPELSLNPAGVKQ